MMLGCDIVVAVEQATFGLPEARVGRLPLDGGNDPVAASDFRFATPWACC